MHMWLLVSVHMEYIEVSYICETFHTNASVQIQKSYPYCKRVFLMQMSDLFIHNKENMHYIDTYFQCLFYTRPGNKS